MPHRSPLHKYTTVTLAVMLLTGFSQYAQAELRYRVELLVFQNLLTEPTPMTRDEPRRFHQALSLDESTPGHAPVRLEKQDGTFANIWRRLDRLEDYRPLARMTWEQSVYDYHPPVRVHDEQIMASELHFPGPVVYIDLTDRRTDRDIFEAFRAPIYRLDGTAQLRRSRFLHVDLDLEFRLDGPAWDQLKASEQHLTLIETPSDTLQPVTMIEEETDVTEALTAEPFRQHRLQQSRQIRTNTMQYFDSAFLGAIVRVTPIADEES